MSVLTVELLDGCRLQLLARFSMADRVLQYRDRARQSRMWFACENRTGPVSSELLKVTTENFVVRGTCNVLRAGLVCANVAGPKITPNGFYFLIANADATTSAKSKKAFSDKGMLRWMDFGQYARF